MREIREIRALIDQGPKTPMPVQAHSTGEEVPVSKPPAKTAAASKTKAAPASPEIAKPAAKPAARASPKVAA